MPKALMRRRTDKSRLASSVAANPWKWLLGVAGGVGVVVTAITASLDMWGRVDGHWQTKEAAEQHARDDKDKNGQQDRKIDTLGLWNRYGTTSLRAQFMEDRVYDCAAKKSTGARMSVADATICERYAAIYRSAQEQADALRKRIDEANRAAP